MRARAVIFEMFVPSGHILKWRILKIGLFQESFVVQLTRNPKEMKRRKVEAILKQCLRIFPGRIHSISQASFAILYCIALQVCLKYQRINFGTAVCVPEKQSCF